MSKYKELLEELQAYARSAGEAHELMRRIALRLHEQMARYNWVGFYLADPASPRSLVLGPYVGSFVPLERISFDAGLCGAAASTRKTVVVNNVAADIRYLSRTDMVKSELVVPILAKNELVAEIDVESYFVGTFLPQDMDLVEACAAMVGRFIEIHGAVAVKTL